MNEWLKPDVLMQAISMLIAIIVAAFASYYAIKGDLRVMHERMDGIKEKQADTEKRVGVIESDVKMIMYGGDRRHLHES